MRIVERIRMDRTTSAVSYTASGISFFGGLMTLNDLALIVGIFCAIATLLINKWYQKREDIRKAKFMEEQSIREKAQEEREKELHAARMKQLNTGS
jgi:H+/gluconate symporter-like permease